MNTKGTGRDFKSLLPRGRVDLQIASRPPATAAEWRSRLRVLRREFHALRLEPLDGIVKQNLEKPTLSGRSEAMRSKAMNSKRSLPRSSAKAVGFAGERAKPRLRPSAPPAVIACTCRSRETQSFSDRVLGTVSNDPRILTLALEPASGKFGARVLMRMKLPWLSVAPGHDRKSPDRTGFRGARHQVRIPGCAA